MQRFPMLVQKTFDAGITGGATVLRIAPAIKRSVPFPFPKDLSVLEFAFDEITLALDTFRRDTLLHNKHLGLIFRWTVRKEKRMNRAEAMNLISDLSYEEKLLLRELLLTLKQNPQPELSPVALDRQAG